MHTYNVLVIDDEFRDDVVLRALLENRTDWIALCR